MKKATPLFLLFFFAFKFSHSQYVWNNVGSGMNAPVTSFAVDPSAHILYAGGIFTQTGSLPAVNIAKWDGSTWSPLSSGIINGSAVSTLLYDGTGLIAGGTFTNIGGTTSKNIARWDGSSWSALGAGLDNSGTSSVNALAVYNNELYAGGLFNNSGGSPVNFIAKWDGMNWQPLGTGTNGIVSSLCVYNNELYAGGSFTDAGGVSVKNLAKWNGTSWSDVGGGVYYTGATTVSTMLNYASALFVGGTFSTAGTTPVNNIAVWNGTTWSDPGGGTRYTGATTVSTMLNFNNALVVGGTFDSLGNAQANNIGAWDGSSWSPLGDGTNSSVLALEALSDTLYAGGLFTTADTELTPFIAEWIPANNTAVLTAVSNETFPPLMVYPNPVSEHLYLKANVNAINKNSVFDFELFDVLGNKVYENSHVTKEICFDRSAIPPGLYIYRISDIRNNLITQGKLSFK